MNAEQTQAVEIKAAADNAMLKGITRIEEAAVEAALPIQKELKAVDEASVGKKAQTSLNAAETKQAAALKVLLDAEKARQTKEMVDMEAGAHLQAMLSADHVRQTAEQWAENQAKNAIALSANGAVGVIMQKAESTAKIRQEATELTKAAIETAARSLNVAQQAQLAIDNVPKEMVLKAKKNSTEMQEEQKALNVDIENAETSSRRVARLAAEGYDQALRTLKEAQKAELTAREALETSRTNAGKIQVLKDRAQAVAEKSFTAEEELKKSRM
jgi:hypothetical protein